MSVKFNKELLLKVKEKILVHHGNFDMCTWIGIRNPGSGGLATPSYTTVFIADHPECGTTACIAGWAMAIEKQMYQNTGKANEAAYEAAQILGLDYFTDANKLFYICEWPQEFMDRYLELDNYKGTSEERAKVTAEYIDYFIEVMENGGFQ